MILKNDGCRSKCIYLILLALIVVMTAITTIPVSAGTEKKEHTKDTTGYIYIGDSRFVGMNSACDIDSNSNAFVIAKIGEGYEYLKYTAEGKMGDIISGHPEYDEWKIIICLGVNDLGNVKKYKEEFKNLALKEDLYVVSVNPVECHDYISNDMISSFNREISSVANIHYIDSYSELMNSGFSTVDGLHYTMDTYKKIYNLINKNLS